MIGRALAHYRITAAIGAGGMGQVYRATDTRLGREVALKILPEEAASNPEMLERFRREARAVAALNHPHIVTIYSVEEADGVHFLTMELIEGHSLDRLIPEGGLAVERILDIATAMSSALAAAHDKGIVHRDLKPANVMVTRDGAVKVLDFGLAKMQEQEGAGDDTQMPTAMQTSAGVVMGTRPYMSPEQVHGQVLDHRTDIFSLGVVLYEMTTGRRPFHGQSAADFSAAILRDTVPPVTDDRDDLPPDLARVIRRCLEKDPRRRIQTARDIGNELRDSRSASPSVPMEAARVTAREGSGPSGIDEGFRVAVLPFKASGTSAELTALAEGMSEQIVTGLSRFSYLRVIALGSTSQFASGAVDVRAAGKELGARYVMEGSLRHAGSSLRVTVQLVDSSTGAHLWAESYNRPFDPGEIFALQDDLVPRIVSTVADMHGVLPRSMSEAVRSRHPDELSPYEAVLRSFGYFDRVSPEELAAARSGLEAAVRKARNYADAWSMLALLFAQEYGQGFRLQADPLASGLTAARRAVELAPSSHLAHFSLAQVLFFQKELASFRNAAERAAALNPMDGNSTAFLGELLTYAGDLDRGLELAARAKQLNPNHPGWYWYADFYDAYRRRDYRSALAFVSQVNLPDHWGMPAFTAAACGQLGQRDAAAKAARDLLQLRPDFAATVRGDLEKWFDAEYRQNLIDGFRKAGLEVPDEVGTAPAPAAADARPASHSGETRADEGFWVAVLPFKYAATNAEIATMAEGLTEEVVTGLSRFSYLRVIARSSTSQYAGGAVDVREVGKRIGARYVMEGSLRVAGAHLRLAVQLVDANTGANLWAEAYDRPFDAGATFAIQDDLVSRIVSTCADHFGVLARVISEAVRARPLAEMTPYEALMRGFGYHFRISPTEHAQARGALEQAVERAPGNPDCLAMLSWIYSHEHAHGFNPLPASLERALTAAKRAVDLAPANHLAHQALAVVLFFRKDKAACLSAAERAMALNPLDASNEAIFLIAFTGDWERGCALVRRAMELNPHHPGWYGLVLGLYEYRRGNYRAAVDEAVKANVPDVFWTNVLLAAAHAELGKSDAARQALDALLAQKADFARTGAALLEKWFDAPMVGQLMAGLRKAGLG